jgi:hypothetical protein
MKTLGRPDHTIPFEAGQVYVTRIGFASIPMCCVDIVVPQGKMEPFVRLAREMVYAALEEGGIERGAICDVCGVRQGKRRSFVDRNPLSASHGKKKFGIFHEFHFEIHAGWLHRFTWDWNHGHIPCNRPDPDEDDNVHLDFS